VRGWAGEKGTPGFGPSFFATMGKNIFLRISTFQANLRLFYPYHFVLKISKKFQVPFQNFENTYIQIKVGNTMRNSFSHTTIEREEATPRGRK
jgi:hypothetical protein